MPQISTAVVTIIAVESPSARNATPSGGLQLPTEYCSTLWVLQTAPAIANAMASPAGIRMRAMRSA